MATNKSKLRCTMGEGLLFNRVEKEMGNRVQLLRKLSVMVFLGKTSLLSLNLAIKLLQNKWLH